jgi:hypothetical protein
MVSVKIERFSNVVVLATNKNEMTTIKLVKGASKRRISVICYGRMAYGGLYVRSVWKIKTV